MNFFATTYEHPYYPEHPESGAGGGFVANERPGDTGSI